MAIGFGTSSSKSKSTSSSFGLDFGSTFVDPSQQPFLDFLRNTGQGVAQDQLGGIGSLFGTAQGLGQQGQQFLGQLGGNPFLDALGQQAGGNPALVAQQTQQLGADIGQFTQEQLLPGIRRGATAVGGLGGGRQGVAEGQAIQGAQRAFSQGATGFATADAQRAQQAAATGGGLLGQGAQAGLGALGGLFGLAQAPFDAQFNPLLNLQGLIGGPTVLSEQFGVSGSEAKSKSSASSFNVSGL